MENIQTFVPQFRLDVLDKSHQLKYLLILLFSFEAVVPAFSEISATHAETSGYAGIKEESNLFDLFSILYICEPGTEERTEKGVLEVNSSFLEIFSSLIKFEPIFITWILPQEKFNSQPPLFTLHRVLLI